VREDAVGSFENSKKRRVGRCRGVGAGKRAAPSKRQWREAELGVREEGQVLLVSVEELGKER
jgi:hypothetical protein